MKTSFFLTMIVAALALIWPAPSRAAAPTMLVYTANTFGEHSPCPS